MTGTTKYMTVASFLSCYDPSLPTWAVYQAPVSDLPPSLRFLCRWLFFPAFYWTKLQASEEDSTDKLSGPGITQRNHQAMKYVSGCESGWCAAWGVGTGAHTHTHTSTHKHTHNHARHKHMHTDKYIYIRLGQRYCKTILLIVSCSGLSAVERRHGYR